MNATVWLRSRKVYINSSRLSRKVHCRCDWIDVICSLINHKLCTLLYYFWNPLLFYLFFFISWAAKIIIVLICMAIGAINANENLLLCLSTYNYIYITILIIAIVILGDTCSVRIICSVRRLVVPLHHPVLCM